MLDIEPLDFARDDVRWRIKKGYVLSEYSKQHLHVWTSMQTSTTLQQQNSFIN